MKRKRNERTKLKWKGENEWKNEKKKEMEIKWMEKGKEEKKN